MAEKTAVIDVKGADGEAQDVGYRIFLLTTLDGFGLETGKPLNVPGGGVRVVVRGEDDVIKAAVADLMSRKPDAERVGKVSVEYSFGNYPLVPFTDKELQLLTLNQLSKGIPAIIRMDSAVNQMNEKLSEVNTSIKDMDAKTTPVVSEMASIGTVVGGLDRKYHTISQNLRYQLLGMGALILIGLACCVLLAVK